jgi:hypothetical protein
MAVRFGFAAAAALLCTPAWAQSVLLDETFDTYTSQFEFEQNWTPDQGAGYQPTFGSSKGYLVPISGIGVAPYNNPPGLIGNGVNVLTGINEWNPGDPDQSPHPLASLVPTETLNIKLSGDMFHAGDVVNAHRTTIAIRNDTAPRPEFGVFGYNFLELGFYNANANDPTENPGAVIPASTFAYRITLFGAPGGDLVRDPNWQYFPLDPALENTGNAAVVNADDIGEGWHRFTAEIGVNTVKLTLDLYRDGLKNTEATPGIGSAGVDSEVIWEIAPTNVIAADGLDFDPFNSLRIGTPSGSASLTEAVVDNVKLETVLAAVAEDNADFDNDGDADGADFLIWQRNVGTGGGQPQGNADGIGGIDGDDLAIWEDQFVNGLPSTAAATAIPEPASLALAGTALVAGIAASRRRR